MSKDLVIGLLVSFLYCGACFYVVFYESPVVGVLLLVSFLFFMVNVYNIELLKRGMDSIRILLVNMVSLAQDAITKEDKTTKESDGLKEMLN
jgi:hypothetical protein